MKIIIYIVLILLCISSMGCSDTEQDTATDKSKISASNIDSNLYIKRDHAYAGSTNGSIATDGSNIYFSGKYEGYGVPMLLKYNIDSGMYRSACLDPLCEHGTACHTQSLKHSTSIVYHNSKLYYYREIAPTYEAIMNGMLRTIAYMEYDGTNQHYRMLEEADGQTIRSSPNTLFAGNYRYYFGMLSFGETDDANDFSFTLMRQDLNTLKSEVVKENASSYLPTLATEYAVFFKTKGGYELRDEKTLEVIGLLETPSLSLTYDGEYIYGKWIEGGDTVFSRIDPQTYESEEYTLPGIIQHTWLSDDYIYFTYNKKKTVMLSNAEMGEYEFEYADSDVYKLDKASFDSGEPIVTQLCAFDGEWEHTALAFNSFIEADGALYGLYFQYSSEGSEGVSERTSDFLLRIDCETGEISIVEGTVQ